MKKISPLLSLVPCPEKVEFYGGSCPLATIDTVSCEPQFAALLPEITAIFAAFDLKTAVVKTAGKITLASDAAIPAEGFTIDIGEKQIILRAADAGGMFYALQSMRQLLALGMIRGPLGATLDCGRITDAPLLRWRGFMLDSARHFQPVTVVKDLLRRMAEMRLNVFHWHLTDGDGWRFPLDSAPELAGLAGRSPGQYTREDIAEIRDFAARHFIKIVPELDIPGHSRGLLKLFPHLACDPSAPGAEYCLAKPEVKDFLRHAIKAMADLFPDSEYLHLGGDEATTANWEKCPLCQAELRKIGGADMRALENSFMREMAAYTQSLGCKVIMWGTGSSMPPEVNIQIWLGIHDFHQTLRNGNHAINSVHTSYYFDYPADLHEPSEPWMFALTEESIYMAEPHIHYCGRLDEPLLGTESCLWTEYVPYWRLISKVAPRLSAYAEVAWSAPSRRDWDDFQRRKAMLRAAGVL